MYKVRLTIAGEARLYGVNNGLLDVNLSALRVAEVNDFFMEPQRVEIDLLEDEWLINHLIEIEDPGIGQCEVINMTEEVVFKGYLDEENVRVDAVNEQMRMTCYSYMELFVKYGDTTLSDVMGISEKTVDLARIVEMYRQTLEAETGIYLPIDMDYDNTQIESQKLLWSRLHRNPANTNPNFQIEVEPYLNRYGFEEKEDRVVFYYFKYMIQLPIGTLPLPDDVSIGDKFTPMMDCYIVNIYNKICVEVEDLSEKLSEEDSFDDALDALRSVIRNHERLYGTHWVDNLTLGGYEYSYSQDVWLTGPFVHKVTYSGNILEEDLVFDDATLLEALKVFINILNLNIISRKDGSLVITNNEQMSTQDYGNIDEYCVSFTLNRDKRVLPTFESLDKLRGDTDLLKKELQRHYLNAYHGRILAEITVEGSAMEFEMFSTLSVKGNQYRIVELQNSLAKDQVKLKAWRL